MGIRILDVGECGFDGPRMQELWEETLGAKVDRVHTGDEALHHLKRGGYNIVLVNRVLAADGSSGLEVIKRLIDSGTNVPVMLVSDRPEAQDEAVELGAVRGFGKAALEDESTIVLVKQTAKR